MGALAESDARHWAFRRGFLIAPVFLAAFLALACGGAKQEAGVPSTRTVTGARTITYLPLDSATGEVVPESANANPVDPGGFISAQFGDGGSRPGTYNPSTGQFAIPDVVLGHYWLKIERGNLDHYIWTDKGSVDLGTTEGRRRSVKSATTSPTDIVFNLTGLSSWQVGDYLQFFDYNSDASLDPVAEAKAGAPAMGDVSLSGLTVDWAARAYPLVDATRGDRPRLLQMIASSVDSQRMWIARKEFAPPALVMSNGKPATVEGAFSELAANSMVTVHLNGAEFDKMNEPFNPVAKKQSPSFSFLDAPGLTSFGYQGGALCILRTDALGTDVNLGQVPVPSPIPGFERMVRGYSEVYMDLRLGTSTPWRYKGGLKVLTSALPTDGSPLRPMISPVRLPMLKEKSLFLDQKGVGLAPRLSWLPPMNGTPQGYLVHVYALSTVGNATQGKQVATLWLGGDHTELEMPQGVFEMGKTYFLCLRSWTESGFDPESAPFRTYRLPFGFADSFSGLISP